MSDLTHSHTHHHIYHHIQHKNHTLYNYNHNHKNCIHTLNYL